MIPLPVNPNVVVLLDENGNVASFATNVAPELDVKVTYSKEVFDEMSLGKSFKVNTFKGAILK